MHRAPVIQSWRFAELMELAPQDRVLTAQPFFWSAGIAMSLGATLAAGGCLILQETFDAGAAQTRDQPPLGLAFGFACNRLRCKSHHRSFSPRLDMGSTSREANAPALARSDVTRYQG